jgi:two-component system KDP operon response regulator KdpE
LFFQGQGIRFSPLGAEYKMAEEERLLASKEALAYLKRIERLLETIAEDIQEYLEISRQLLNSPALRADVAQVDAFRVTPSADQAQAQAVTIREVTINPAEHMVTLRDQPIELTPTEFDILFCLMRNGGRVLSCQELVHEAQGYELDERDARYLIRPHITRLRQKLAAEPGAPEYIHNVRGIGYFFERRTEQRN